MGKQKVDWNKLQIEYETTQISLRDLADKHGVKFSALKEHACPRNKDIPKWSRSKEITQQKIHICTEQKTIEKIADKIAAMNELHFDLSNMVLEIAKGALQDPEQFYRHVGKKVEKVQDEDSFSQIETFEDKLLDAINSKALAEIVTAIEKSQKVQRKAAGVIDGKDKAILDMHKEKLDIEREKVQKENDPDKKVINIHTNIPRPDPDYDPEKDEEEGE